MQFVAQPVLILALWVALIISLPYGWKPSAAIGAVILLAYLRSK